MGVVLETRPKANDNEQRGQKLIELIQQWRDAHGEEAAEQIDTWDYLQHALNDNRLSNRRRV